MGGDVEEPPPTDARRRSASGGASARDAPLVLYTGTFEAYQGLDLLLEALGIVAADASTRSGCSSSAAAPSRSRLRAPCAGRGRRRPSSPAPARARDPGVRRGGGHPGVAADRRHEHAAEDLLVPAVGQADRRDRPADPHAGARPRDRAARVRPKPAAFAAARRGCSTTAHCGRGISGAAARARADARYSRDVYVSLHQAGLRARLAARRRRRSSRRAHEGSRHRRDRVHWRSSRAAPGSERQRRRGARAAGERCARAEALAARRHRDPRRGPDRRRGSHASACDGMRGRVPHRRHLPRSRAGRRGVHARQRRGTRHVLEAARRGWRPPRRALQHGRRARAYRAPAGERGRALRARRRLPARPSSRPSSWRREFGQRHRSRGRRRPADRHLRARATCAS